MPTDPTVKPDLITRARQRFLSDTTNHQMTVLRDDGLYRHLRFQVPGDWAYRYDLITWPGFLAVTGDMGEYLFTRIDDMFSFFGAEQSINPDYWSEKLAGKGTSDQAHVFTVPAFQAVVLDWYRFYAEDLEPAEASALRAAIDNELLADDIAPSNSHEGYQLLDSFNYGEHHITDCWEYNMTEFDSRFLWCCWGIVAGIKQYRENKLQPVEVQEA